MPSEKFFVHKEDGSLVRLKGRLVRFLDEEPPTGSDKSAIRTALEVSPDAEGLVQADVGTGPQNLVLHQHLGTMAYADIAGVSVDNLEVTGKLEIDSSGNVSIGAGDIANNGSLHVYRSSATADLNLQSAGGSGRSFAIQSKTNGSLVVRDNNGAANRLTVGSGGHIGIANDSPGSANGSANNLVIGNSTTSTSTGISIVTQPNRVGSLFFANGTSGVSGYVGRVQYDHSTNALSFGVNGMVPWSISSTGNLVASGAYGIDFGTTTTSAGQGTGTTGSVSNSVLSDYEYGSWTPTIAPSGGSFTSITMDVQSATYVKVGRMVHCQAYIRTDGLDSTGASGSVRVTGLPFVNSGSSNYAAVSVGLSRNWVTNPAGGYVNNGVASLTLTKRTTSSTELVEMEPADMTTGSGTDKNAVLMSFQYIAST